MSDRTSKILLAGTMFVVLVIQVVNLCMMILWPTNVLEITRNLIPFLIISIFGMVLSFSNHLIEINK